MPTYGVLWEESDAIMLLSHEYVAFQMGIHTLTINGFYDFTYTTLMHRKYLCLFYAGLAWSPFPIIGNKGTGWSQWKHRLENGKDSTMPSHNKDCYCSNCNNIVLVFFLFPSMILNVSVLYSDAKMWAVSLISGNSLIFLFWHNHTAKVVMDDSCIISCLVADFSFSPKNT